MHHRNLPAPPPDETRSTNVPALHQAAAEAWQEVLPLLGNGISLPVSFDALKNKLDATVNTLTPLIRRLYELIPAQQAPVEDDFRVVMVVINWPLTGRPAV